jgi:hypothetical protein
MDEHVLEAWYRALIIQSGEGKYGKDVDKNILYGFLIVLCPVKNWGQKVVNPLSTRMELLESRTGRPGSVSY